MLFSIGPALTGGSKKTLNYGRKHRKPAIRLSRSGGPQSAEAELLRFVREQRIQVLNVAGPRASEEPEVAAFVREVLQKAWAGT